MCVILVWTGSKFQTDLHVKSSKHLKHLHTVKIKQLTYVNATCTNNTIKLKTLQLTHNSIHYLHDLYFMRIHHFKECLIMLINLNTENIYKSNNDTTIQTTNQEKSGNSAFALTLPMSKPYMLIDLCNWILWLEYIVKKINLHLKSNVIIPDNLREIVMFEESEALPKNTDLTIN